MTGLPAYVLEAQFGSFFGVPSWYDLSTFLDLEAVPLTVTRGRVNEQSLPTPGQLTCQLFDDDGRFTPGLATSPYAPYVVDGAPIRLSVIMPSTVNREDNNSHEQGLGEWQPAGPGTGPGLTQSTTHVYADGGGWAMLVTWVNQATASAAQRRIQGLTVGTQYTVSRYVYVPTGSPDVQLVVGDGVAATGSAVTTKDAYTRATVTFVATQPSHNLQVQVTSSVGGGQCWTDAGQVETGAAATALAAGAVKLPRFYGPALEWSMTWDGPAGLAATTQLVATDILRRLPRHGTLRPFDVEEALYDSPVTYLPLDEPQGATQVGNLGSWQGAGTPVNPGGGGTLTFAGSTGPPADGTSAPMFAPASASSGWYISAPSFLVTAAVTVEAFINTPTTGRAILDLSGTVRGSTGAGPTLSVEAGTGKLRWDSDFGALSVTSSASVADGATHHVAATYVHDGANHTARLYVDGVLVTTAGIASTTVGLGASYLSVGGGAKLGLFAGTINHVGVYAAALSADRLAAHWHAGWDGFGGERSDQRVSRLAAYAGLASLTPGSLSGVWVLGSASLSVLGTTTTLAASSLDLEVGNAMVYGQADGGADPLAAMNDVATTEGGLVLIDRTGRLQFQARGHRYNRPTAVGLDSGDVNPGLTVVYDDTDVVNDVTVTTQDGAGVRLVSAASVTQRGTYDQTLTLLTRDPLDAYSAAGWRINRFAQPAGRYPTLVADLNTLPDTLVAQLLTVDVGDRISLSGLPPQAPASTVGLFVEGYTETVSWSRYDLQLNTTADAWQVWALGNPSLSVLGTTTIPAW